MSESPLQSPRLTSSLRAERDGTCSARFVILTLLALALLFFDTGRAYATPANICEAAATGPRIAPTFSLDDVRQAALSKELQAKVSKYAATSRPDLLLKIATSFNGTAAALLRNGMLDPRKMIDEADLRQLAGYADFLSLHGLSAKEMSLEIRIEGSGAKQKMYLLSDIEHSLIHSSENGNLLWSHDESWAKERFLENVSGSYLCGQFMGSSKFVSLGNIPANATKQGVLKAFGLIGYPDFDKPGPFYLVSVSGTADRFEQVKPRVPLLYKWVGANGDWELATNFGKGTIPGFTSGGMSEVVISTFSVEARDLEDLKEKGIEVRTFVD